jgi:HSP20 family molecular chaperone IbpA
MDYYYAPTTPWTTTHVDRSFPKQHWHLENTLHKIGHNVQDFVHRFENDFRQPHVDIRETVDSFYIDVELPGLGAKEDVQLRWTNDRTLFVEAALTQPKISESDSLLSSPAVAEDGEADKAKQERINAPQNPIHHLVRERRLGPYARAFYFNVDVDHPTMKTTLRDGLLRISMKKVREEQR